MSRCNLRAISLRTCNESSKIFQSLLYIYYGANSVIGLAGVERPFVHIDYDEYDEYDIGEEHKTLYAVQTPKNSVFQRIQNYFGGQDKRMRLRKLQGYLGSGVA
jgi:hypothetical protein